MLPMNVSKEVKGPDTITPIDKMPENPKLAAATMIKQTLVSEEWNKASIAMLPTCFLCKVPLVWHSYPGKDAVLFHCPNCGTQWKKNRSWNKDMEFIGKEAL